MRKALNENPVVQAVVIGLMALVVVFLLFTRVLSSGSGGEEASPTPTTDAAATATPAPAPSTTPAPAEGTAPAAPAPSPATGETAPQTGTPSIPGAAPATVGNGFVPGPGLPNAVVSAYDSGDAVVLLIEKEKGLDDRAVKGSVERLRARGDATVFVVPAADVSKYARITEGVQLSRTPAIVVLRPKRLSKGIPEATVSYGFRGPESVEQALDDALYKGKNVTYDP